jgi:anaerobic magnesium-protoporphyrin IX monomethyl ester cyclase
MANKRIDLILITVGSQGAQDMHHLPLGILYVGSLLKSNGFDVHLHHLLPGGIVKTMKEIARQKPLLAGFSVLSGMTTYWTAVASEILKQIEPLTKIAWGGHHATILAEDCLKESYVDLVIRGEGEYTTLELAQALTGQGTPVLQGLKGVSFKDESGRIVHNPARLLIQDLDKLVLDYDLLPMDRYLGKSKIRNISLFSSRGCPYNCAFCSTPEFFGNAYRAHSASYITAELEKLKRKYQINSVYFCDDNFYLDKKRAREIIKTMAPMGISCDTLDVRLDQIVEEDLAYFKEYKVRGIFFGWESGNDRLLALMGKRVTTAAILEKASAIARYDLPCWGSGMMLLPTETEEETRQTIDFSIKLREILPGSTIGLFRFMPLPGTELTALAQTQGFIQPQNQKDWKIIDPLENYYQAGWIPWMTLIKDRNLRYIQELSRQQITQFSKRQHGISRQLQNIFAGYMKKRFNTMDFNLLWEPPVYNTLRAMHGVFTGRPYQAPETRILCQSREKGS